MVSSVGFEGGKTLRQEMREAVTLIAKKHGVTVNDIMAPRRAKVIVAARHEAIHYVKAHTTWSTPQIGKFFGGIDHTTVLHAVKKHNQRLGA
jgi:chromosomal replication initiator protein